MEHLTKTFFGMTFNTDTILVMWAVMLFIIVLSFLATRKLSIFPSKMQVAAEAVVGMFVGLTKSMLGEKENKQHVPLVASLFLFIVVSNLAGQLPLKLYHLSKGEMASPTNDINLTAAMALIVLVYYVTCGLIKKKHKFFIHGFSVVDIIMFLVEILDMFTRPLTLALRLFGNIMAGEILISALISMCAIGLPLAGMVYEVLVAFIQALVFTMLTITYIASAIEQHE